MTMQFKHVSSIALLPLIRLIIEFEWGSLYINLRRSGMLSSKNCTRAHETTKVQISSVLDMAERTAATTVMLFCSVNIGAGCKCILSNSTSKYLMLYNIIIMLNNEYI